MSPRRVRIQNQMEALLEEARIKLSGVISDLLGVSGQRILAALAEGETDPAKLVTMAADNLKASKEQLAEAVSGPMQSRHRRVLAMQLEELDLLTSTSPNSGNWEMPCASIRTPFYGCARCRACGRMPPWQMIAELGPEAAAFETAEQMASWIGVCPGREESAGESKSNRSPKGNRTMRRGLNQVAWSAVRTKDSFFRELYHRLIPRLGVHKAIWAIAHRMAKVMWKILTTKSVT